MYLGKDKRGQNVRLPAEDLLTHCVVLGQTGSGKSGLTIALLEEVAKSGANALVLDPKGDLTNLALSLSTEDEFAEWTDLPDEDRLTHGDGLAKSDLSFRDVEEWRDHVNVKIYAPGATSGGGRRVNMFPSLDFPGSMDRVSRERASQLVTAVLSAVDADDDPFDPAVVFLTEAVMGEWRNGRGLPADEWPGVLTDPDEHLASFGGMALNDFFPKSQRTKLARKLIGFQHQADRWFTGEQLDMEAMVASPKPEIAVFCLRHLQEDDRQFFAALLLNKVVDFMSQTSASERLKMLVVLDEARGYLPPTRKPPTKEPIQTLLAQGRAQGIGMLVGTQNPMHLDYEALSNVGTWFVGRLRERDCARDLNRELSNRGVELEKVIAMPQRNFLLLDKRREHKQFQTRWCLNYLLGPLTDEQLLKLEPERKVSPPRVTLRPAPVVVTPRPVVTAPKRTGSAPYETYVSERPVFAEVPAVRTMRRAFLSLVITCLQGFALLALAFVLFCYWLGTR